MTRWERLRVIRKIGMMVVVVVVVGGRGGLDGGLARRNNRLR